MTAGGIERIRTAVAGFADLSLAARPRCHYCNGWQIYIYFGLTQEKLKVILKLSNSPKLTIVLVFNNKPIMICILQTQR